MLDHLGAEDPAQGIIWEPGEVGKRFGLLHLKSSLSAGPYHLPVQVNASRLDSGLSQELKKFSTAAPDIQHRLQGEIGEVDPLSLLDLLPASSMEVLEG